MSELKKSTNEVQEGELTELSPQREPEDKKPPHTVLKPRRMPRCRAGLMIAKGPPPPPVSKSGLGSQKTPRCRAGLMRAKGPPPPPRQPESADSDSVDQE